MTWRRQKLEPADWFREELARLERGFRAGNYPSLLEALSLCNANRLALPAWIADATAEAVAGIASGKPSTGTAGRSGGHAERFEKDREHMRRYQAACHWLPRLKDHKRRLGRATLLDGKWEVTRKGAFEAAAAMIGEASWQAVKTSHERVSKAKKAGTAERYEAALRSFDLPATGRSDRKKRP